MFCFFCCFFSSYSSSVCYALLNLQVLLPRLVLTPWHTWSRALNLLDSRLRAQAAGHTLWKLSLPQCHYLVSLPAAETCTFSLGCSIPCVAVPGETPHSQFCSFKLTVRTLLQSPDLLTSCTEAAGEERTELHAQVEAHIAGLVLGFHTEGASQGYSLGGSP